MTSISVRELRRSNMRQIKYTMSATPSPVHQFALTSYEIHS